MYLHHAAEDSLCDLEIQDQAAGVHDGGDEGGRHDGRVGAQLLGGQRQHTAHQLCEADAEEQGPSVEEQTLATLQEIRDELKKANNSAE